MEVKLSGFNYFRYGIVPLGKGYLNSALKQAGHDSRIQLFEDKESIFYDELQSVKFFGHEIHDVGVTRYTERIELTSNTLFGELLNFVDHGDNKLISRYPDKISAIQKELEGIANSLCKADVVGFGFLPPAIGVIFYLCKLIKEEDKDIKIVLGGPITDVLRWVMAPNSYFYEELNGSLIKEGIYGRYVNFLKNNVDYLVHGEGENTIVEIVNRLEEGDKNPDILGTTTIKDGKIHYNAERPLSEINYISPPDFSGINLKNYHALSFIFSRGCINACRFCDETHFWKSYRVRDPQFVLDELVDDLNKYHMNYFVACDSLLNGRPKELERLCNHIIDSGIDINWSGNLRLMQTDKKLLQILYKSGYRRAKFGLESLDQSVLDQINKNQTLDHSVEILRVAKEVGMNVSANLMVGYIGGGVDYEIKMMEKMKKYRPFMDYLSLQSIDIGLRTSFSRDINCGFKTVSTSSFKEELWSNYSLAHSYVPGMITYVKNALTRAETDYIFEMYAKNRLTTSWNLEYLLYTLRLNRLKGMRKYVPIYVKSKLKSYYVKNQQYI